MLVPADFHFVPGLAWQAALKKTKVKLDLLTDTDMLWVVEHGRCANDNSKYKKDYGKNKESSYLKYWDK